MDPPGAAALLLGVSASTVCRKSGMPAWHDCDPDGLAPVAHIHRFMAAAARAAGSPTFGIAIMEMLPVDRLGTLGRGVTGSKHLYEVLKTGVRLMPGHTNFSNFWLGEKQDAVWLCRGSSHFRGPGEDQGSQYALLGMIQTVQLCAGAQWWPKSVVLQGRRASAVPPAEALGGARVLLHPELTAICVPRELLPLSNHRRSAESPAPLASSLVEQTFFETAPAATLEQPLKQLVATMLPHHYPSIETMAEILGVQPRALQRILQARSISYRQLVDEVRAEQATVLLRVGDASVTDIAFELGYTDPAHLTRAFRRWTGVSPSRYRGSRRAA
jgi:AraC-like DNA-binding protein